MPPLRFVFVLLFSPEARSFRRKKKKLRKV